MNETERAELIRNALLASYNTDKPEHQKIALEDEAAGIWLHRAKTLLRMLEDLEVEA